MRLVESRSQPRGCCPRGVEPCVNRLVGGDGGGPQRHRLQGVGVRQSHERRGILPCVQQHHLPGDLREGDVPETAQRSLALRADGRRRERQRVHEEKRRIAETREGEERVGREGLERVDALGERDGAHGHADVPYVAKNHLVAAAGAEARGHQLHLVPRPRHQTLSHALVPLRVIANANANYPLAHAAAGARVDDLVQTGVEPRAERVAARMPLHRLAGGAGQRDGPDFLLLADIPQATVPATAVQTDRAHVLSNGYHSAVHLRIEGALRDTGLVPAQCERVRHVRLLLSIGRQVPQLYITTELHTHKKGVRARSRNHLTLV